MRKFLVLVFVAVMCVPSYGSILVYKTAQTGTALDITGPAHWARKQIRAI